MVVHGVPDNAAAQDAGNGSTISNFAGITLPKPLTAKGEVTIHLDTASLDTFHGQLLSSLSKSEQAINAARQDHFELRSGVIEISEKIGNHTIHLNSLKTEIFKLKEDNAAQQDQIVELRTQLQVSREGFQKIQEEQANAIKALTAEVRASAEKIASLSKAHSAATQQLDTLAKQEAARGSPALRPAQPAASPYLRSAAPPASSYEIQWPGSVSASPAPSPMMRSVVTHAPGAILPPPPMPGDMLWSSAPGGLPGQQIIFR